MTKNFSRLLSALILVAVLLTACTGTANTTTEEKTPIRIGWSLYPGWYPLVLAQELGLYEKHNVQVELVLYETYKDTAPQLAAGLVDGAALVLGDVLLDDVGNSSSVVLITDNSNGADQLIASPEVIESQDLRGKRIGISAGTFGELLVRQMLDEYGVDFDEVQLVEVPPEAVADSIPGTIDIGHTFEPFASQARAKGNGVLFTSADAPGIIVDTVSFTHSFIEERPEDVRNFINAWFEAVEYWQANPEEGNALIAEATGQDPADVNFEGIKFFDRAANLATFQPGVDTTSVVFTAQLELDFLIATGVITHPQDINIILNPSYLQ
jgi:NitT/TauT family transport system substrate-binding protein